MVGRPRIYDPIADGMLIREQGLENKSVRIICEETGFSRCRVQKALDALVRGPQESDKPAKEKKKPPRINSIDTLKLDLQPGIVHRFILTSIQDDEPVWDELHQNLLAYAAHVGAHIYPFGFTYQRGLFEDHTVRTACYDAEVRDDIILDRLFLTDDVLVVSDANVLPTSSNPLGGWKNANNGKTVIVPHPRIAQESLPRMSGEKPQFAITTGCLSRPSYTPRAAGRKAIAHHTCGALLVEIDVDGHIFPRHLIADENGSFHDLDCFVANGRVYPGVRVASIVWPDWHHAQIDHRIALATVGYDSKSKEFVRNNNLLDALRPHYQFSHDSLDFRARNHHAIDDPIEMARVAAKGMDNVEDEIRSTMSFLNGMWRDWCETVVIEGNHDNAIAKWLKAPHGQKDPTNAYFWHRMLSVWHDAVRRNETINITESAFRMCGLDDAVHFCGAGQSWIVQDIEHGMHGDLGYNGSRGNPKQFARSGRKSNTGHTHSSGIFDGAYVSGMGGELDQGYNRGPGSWVHVVILTYLSGARTLLPMAADGRYRAMG